MITNVIVTVGASSISNLEVGFTNIDLLSPDDLSEYESLKSQKLSELWSKYRASGMTLEEVSAEAKTLSKLKRMLGTELKVALVTTCTLDGAIASEFLIDSLKEAGLVSEIMPVHDRPYVMVKGLQVKDDKLFRREGLPNLFGILDHLRSQMGRPVIAATGGYKAMLSYVVLYGIIRRLNVYYIYERSEGLLRIPPLPLELSFDAVRKYYIPLYELSKAETEEDLRRWRERYGKLLYEDEFRTLIEEEGDLIYVNPIAELILDRLEERLQPVALMESLENELERNHELKRLLGKLDRKVEMKVTKAGKHLAIDDGDNQNRLLFFWRNGIPHVYALFTRHDEYESFLEKHKPSEFEGKSYKYMLYDKRSGELIQNLSM